MSSYSKCFVAISLLIWGACKSNTAKEQIALADSSSRYETGSPASGNFKADEYDLKDYSEFPYIDSTRDVFGNSYIDTFSIAGNRFRVVHELSDSFPETATIEKLVGNKWLKRIEFYKQNHFYGFHYNEDVNNDGYNDIVRESRFDSEVYFFNPSIKNFIDSVGAEINYEIHLIDTANKIFCDFQERKGGAGDITSTLYTFKSFHKYDLFQLQLYNGDSNDDSNSIITKLILNKCINGNPDLLKQIEVIKLDKPINTEVSDENGNQAYFDNKQFWFKRYKKLLSLK
jgi:hypothetical protein